MKALLYASLLVLLPAAARAALPGDAAEGKRLHDAQCTRCHDSGVYTRSDRRIGSLDALRQRVQACGHAATSQALSAGELRDLLKYLNERFYRFP